MALEAATYIDELVATNPAAGDSFGQGDDHLRLIKAVLLATFPNLTEAMTATAAELNATEGRLDDLESDYLPLAGGTMEGAIAMGGFKVTRLGAAAAANDAVRLTQMQAADTALDDRITAIEGLYLKKDGTVACTGNLNLDSHRLLSVSDGIAAGNGVNLGQVQTLIAAAMGSGFLGALMTKSTTQSLPGSTWTTVSWQTETYDTTGENCAQPSNNYFVIPSYASYARLIATITTDDDGDDVFGIRFTRNGSASNIAGQIMSRAGAGQDAKLQLVSHVIAVTPGDTWQVQAYQEFSGSCNMAVSCQFSIEILE